MAPSTIQTQQIHSNNCTATEELCFLRGLCRDVISRTSEEAVSGVSDELVGE
jgi:hypothetical protein